MCQSDKHDVAALAADVRRLVRERLEEMLPMDEAAEVADDAVDYLIDRLQREGGAG